MRNMIAIMRELQASQQMVTADTKAIKDKQEEIIGMTEVWLERIEAYHEKIEAMAKHYKWAPSAKAMHMFTTLQG
jgi:hypothetical protein